MNGVFHQLERVAERVKKQPHMIDPVAYGELKGSVLLSAGDYLVSTGLAVGTSSHLVGVDGGDLSNCRLINHRRPLDRLFCIIK